MCARKTMKSRLPGYHLGAKQWLNSGGRPVRAGTTGGTNEEKLDQTDHVPGCCGHGNFAISAC